MVILKLAGNLHVACLVRLLEKLRLSERREAVSSICLLCFKGLVGAAGWRAAGLPGCRVAGLAGWRAAGLPGCRVAGLPGRRAAGLPGCRAAGPPGCRAAGLAV